MKIPWLLQNRFFFFLSLMLLAVSGTFAQDIILKKNNELIKCKIREIGMDDIKYLLPEFSPDVIFSIDKDAVDKVIFESGTEMAFTQEMTNPANYTDNHKHALKVEFLSPITGNTTLAYEYSLRPGRSIEATLGIVGLGLIGNNDNPAGAFVKAGYKFIQSPEFYIRGLRYAHLLKGGYLKPELALAVYGVDNYTYEYYPVQSITKKRESVISASMQMVMGKQWIMDNSFLVDAFFGIGYGFSSNDRESYHYGYLIADQSFPVSFSAGLKIGFLFK
ncbi:MAG: hypothetical protein PHW35_03380 [Lentimicrobiaceae bacterium]|jgi:hypothetical protein|nr:hypothetical protein [Lentimicrobiaceae bacterium]MDD4596986.1 hypothetical protein [Lentimicrobiaceae bacterium]MDY0026700.1 hypothetical protein [Lentimicrobium sp.]